MAVLQLIVFYDMTTGYMVINFKVSDVTAAPAFRVLQELFSTTPQQCC